jgi:hypothetical protein
MPTAAHALAQLGGSASRSQLTAAVGRTELRTGLAGGQVVRARRGRYVLPAVADSHLAAERLAGVLSFRSAALHHGWSVRTAPGKPEITVPRGRKVPVERRSDVSVSWRTLPADGIQEGWVTTPLQTVLDCARVLPLEEALAVADSALRERAVSRAEVAAGLARLPDRGAAAARRVLTAASPLAANPFESSLRAIALGVRGAVWLPQHPVDIGHEWLLHPDLAEPTLGIALEAEGFEFHGKRQALTADCWRYNELTLRGWLLLRFSWEHVMTQQEWVAACIEAAVESRLTGRPMPDGRPLVAQSA